MGQRGRQINWTRVVRDVASLALAGGTLYLAWKRLDNDVKRVVNLPLDQALWAIADQVPQMSQETYLAFQLRLGQFAEQYPHVQTLYAFAGDVYQTNRELDKILDYSVADAVNIITGILPQKTERQQAALIAVLTKRAQSDIRAQAVAGHLRQLGWGGS